MSISNNDVCGILTEAEACRVEVTQLGTSACGATSLVNVLLCLRVIQPHLCSILNWNMCIVRSRDIAAPLPQYLASRSIAGCTGQELVQSISMLTSANNLPPIAGQFIPFNTILAKGISLIDYLCELFKNGHAVVGCFNLQVLGNDAWHHQAIYAVNTATRMILCMNPICEYPEDLVVQFLSTDSHLFVRGEDVLARIDRPGGDDSVYDQVRWKQYRVREQVQAMANSSVPDSNGDLCDIAAAAKYVVIPANYVGGLAVFGTSPVMDI